MVTVAQRDLARRFLAEEIGHRQDPEALPAAGEQVFQKLCVRLAKLVTATGSHALLARALYLARAEFPFLAGVRAGTVPDTCLDGLRESLQGVEPAQAGDGLVAVLTNMIGLLVTFIGEDLTLRLVRDVWPGAPSGQTSPGVEDART